jgi:steroid delta-isomerase-like uncharacterized protein
MSEQNKQEQNKQIVRRFIHAFMTGNTAVLEEVVAEDLIDHNLLGDLKPGRQGLLDIVAMYRTGFPDIEIAIEREVAEGDFVVQYGRISGTNKGEMMGQPATHRRATFAWMDMHRIVNGQIVESWHVEDIAGMLRQLGLMPN